MHPRKSYTAAFKLEAVAYAKENGKQLNMNTSQRHTPQAYKILMQ
jgi:transposase-like protein